MTNLEHHRSWSSYNYTRSCPRTQPIPFYGHLAFEANWKGEKIDRWEPHELIKNLKNHCFEVLSYSTQQQTISQLDFELQWKVNCMGQPAMISSVAGWNRRSKALPKAKLAHKKGDGHCLVICCWSETLQFYIFIIYLFLLLLFFYVTILYWFCHISTCIHHGCTRVPYLETPSHLPPHTIPQWH